ncbi:MAG: protein translocase subunit SecD [Planctomycetaceae bacterium]|nr:protein translocase subunit SecD [Planctomycetaceae bacterium]
MTKFRLGLRLLTLVTAIGLLAAGSGLVPFAQEQPQEPSPQPVAEETASAESPGEAVPASGETVLAESVAVSVTAENTSEPEENVPVPSDAKTPQVEVKSEETELPTLEPANEAAISPIAVSGAAPEGTIPEVNVPEVSNVLPQTESPVQIGEITTEEVTNSPTVWYHNGYFIVTLYFLIIVACAYVSNSCAKAFRMPDLAVRMFIVLFALFGAIATTILSWEKLTLGIDLSGGVVLVYDVKPRSVENMDGTTVTETGSIDFEQLKRAIDRRINPAGVKEISVQKYGTSQLKIIIPNIDAPEVDRIEKLISDAGSLEFRILASERFDAELIARAKAEKGQRVYDPKSGKNLQAWWVPLNEHEASNYVSNSDLATRQNTRGGYDILVLKDNYDVTGNALSGIKEFFGTDERTHLPTRGVSFQLKGRSVTDFANLTRRYQPDPSNINSVRNLGIILSGELYSAPSLESAIPNGTCQITFNERSGDKGGVQLAKDIQDLIQVMEAGSLPADISKEPISRLLTGSTLGDDTIQSGKISAAVAVGVIMLFMVFYYRFCGIIAVAAVVMNLFMIMAAMLTIRAAFTLSGLAGLVLTLGMAVDANILIFERLREEILGGATLRMAIRNAFTKASSAIIDSNVTTLITAMILYMVGTEQTKGFAITLFLGVLFSMFTAVYCSHVVFDVFENRRWIKKLSMLRLIENPRINFMAMRQTAMGVAIVLCVLSFTAIFLRGKAIFDIDFVGGVNVEVVFKEKQNIADIRSKLSTLSDVTVSAVNADIGGRKEKGSVPIAQGTRFSINTATPPGMTAEAYLKEVVKTLTATFGDNLYYDTIEYKFKESSEAAVPQTVVAMTVDPSINFKALDQSIREYIQLAVDEGKIEKSFGYTLTCDDVEPQENIAESSKAYRNWTILFESGSQADIDAVLKPYQAVFNAEPWFPASNTIGSVVAVYSRYSALAAILLSLVAIAVYLRFRFRKITFGYAAVTSLAFNVFITLGAVASSVWFASVLGFLMIEPFKISLTVIAAFLTIIGYDINDTIILFDRIREVRGKSPLLTIDMINQSTNQVLSRTLLTSVTTLFAVVVLYIFGGAGLHAFAFSLGIGVIAGTCSSIFIAAPLLYWMTGAPGTTQTLQNGKSSALKK